MFNGVSYPKTKEQPRNLLVLVQIPRMIHLSKLLEWFHYLVLECDLITDKIRILLSKLEVYPRRRL